MSSFFFISQAEVGQFSWSFHGTIYFFLNYIFWTLISLIFILSFLSLFLFCTFLYRFFECEFILLTWDFFLFANTKEFYNCALSITLPVSYKFWYILISNQFKYIWVPNTSSLTHGLVGRIFGYFTSIWRISCYLFVIDIQFDSTLVIHTLYDLNFLKSFSGLFCVLRPNLS